MYRCMRSLLVRTASHRSPSRLCNDLSLLCGDLLQRSPHAHAAAHANCCRCSDLLCRCAGDLLRLGRVPPLHQSGLGLSHYSCTLRAPGTAPVKSMPLPAQPQLSLSSCRVRVNGCLLSHGHTTRTEAPPARLLSTPMHVHSGSVLSSATACVMSLTQAMPLFLCPPLRGLAMSSSSTLLISLPYSAFRPANMDNYGGGLLRFAALYALCRNFTGPQ